MKLSKNMTREKTKDDTWLAIDCHGGTKCPYPRLKLSGWCTCCATLCRDEDGNLFFATKPIVEG